MRYPILGAKNPSTHSSSIARRSSRLYIVNICYVLPRSRSVSPLTSSVSRCYHDGSRTIGGAAREAGCVGAGGRGG
ncbi:hypothetical protein B0H13DRAFT_2675526 [Mycena leptocephala]|nr:hypothetical protein B0H13DRAFT_2675526 [Mycena leptocephala]